VQAAELTAQLRQARAEAQTLVQAADDLRQADGRARGRALDAAQGSVAGGIRACSTSSYSSVHAELRRASDPLFAREG
jgi:hypothetical protein